MRHARRPVVSAVLVGVVVLLGACGDNKTSSQGGEIFGPRPSTEANSASNPLSGDGVTLIAPAGTDAATLQAAADVVRTRLTRMGVVNPIVAARTDGVDVQSRADTYQLHAAAQHHATTISAITSTSLGPGNGAGTPSTGPAIRCYVLGPALTGVSPVTGVAVANSSGAGWKISFSVDSNHYKTFRAALEGAGTGPLALVGDGVVVLAFGSGVPALESALGPPLAEDQARQAAATLAVDSDLPVALQPPALPAAPGARVDVDFWTAALGVKICGTWLANAPAFGLDTGVHSHGDGLVYVHPFTLDEAGDKATLGLFLQRGGWHVSSDELKV